MDDGQGTEDAIGTNDEGPAVAQGDSGIMQQQHAPSEKKFCVEILPGGLSPGRLIGRTWRDGVVFVISAAAIRQAGKLSDPLPEKRAGFGRSSGTFSGWIRGGEWGCRRGVRGRRRGHFFGGSRPRIW